MIVTTESGTRYALEVGRVRRVGGDPLRRDGEWLNCQLAYPVALGESMVLFLEPLGEGNVTIRTTTPVIEIQRSSDGIGVTR